MIKDLLLVKDNFFTNPDKILSLFDRQKFYKSWAYPGSRSHNLLESEDDSTRNFALYFTHKIANEVIPGLHGFYIDVRLHINDIYDDEILNQGWIHCDEADLAGIVYLSKEELSLDTGTSIFFKTSAEEFTSRDIQSRKMFNQYGTSLEEYKRDLKDNFNQFTEISRIGNVYNRLVAYDATMFHRPNRYNLSSKRMRQTLVFFIRNVKQNYPEKTDIKFNWVDL